MIHSRVTSKGRTTVPRAVRIALGLKEGERVAYEIDGDRVILTRADEVDDPFTTFEEWASAADAEFSAKL
jgi:antitoxin PrlF